MVASYMINYEKIFIGVYMAYLTIFLNQSVLGQCAHDMKGSEKHYIPLVSSPSSSLLIYFLFF